jgi:hypothetical protein
MILVGMGGSLRNAKIQKFAVKLDMVQGSHTALSGVFPHIAFLLGAEVGPFPLDTSPQLSRLLGLPVQRNSVVWPFAVKAIHFGGQAVDLLARELLGTRLIVRI